MEVWIIDGAEMKPKARHQLFTGSKMTSSAWQIISCNWSLPSLNHILTAPCWWRTKISFLRSLLLFMTRVDFVITRSSRWKFSSLSTICINLFQVRGSTFLAFSVGERRSWKGLVGHSGQFLWTLTTVDETLLLLIELPSSQRHGSRLLSFWIGMNTHTGSQIDQIKAALVSVIASAELQYAMPLSRH